MILFILLNARSVFPYLHDRYQQLIQRVVAGSEGACFGTPLQSKGAVDYIKFLFHVRTELLQLGHPSNKMTKNGRAGTRMKCAPTDASLALDVAGVDAAAGERRKMVGVLAAPPLLLRRTSPNGRL